MTNVGTIPEAALSAQFGQQRRWPAVVRPTRLLRLRWWTGENLVLSVLSCGKFQALGFARGAGLSR